MKLCTFVNAGTVGFVALSGIVGQPASAQTSPSAQSSCTLGNPTLTPVQNGVTAFVYATALPDNKGTSTPTQAGSPCTVSCSANGSFDYQVFIEIDNNTDSVAYTQWSDTLNATGSATVGATSGSTITLAGTATGKAMNGHNYNNTTIISSISPITLNKGASILQGTATGSAAILQTP